MATPDNQQGYTSPTDFRISQIAPVAIPKELRPVFSEMYSFFQQVIQTFNELCELL